MLHLRTMTSKDFPFAVELANTLDWHMVVEDFAFNSGLEPNGCFIALDDSNPVGICTSISFGRVGWFGNLAVKQDFRRKGIGSALVNRSIEYLKSTGTKRIGLYAYTHLAGFYRKFEFKQDQDFAVLKGKPKSFATVKNVQKFKRHDTERIVDFDSNCFGSNRSKVLNSIVKDEDNLCYFCAENDRVAGYGMAKVFYNMAELGPVVCKENSDETAIDLVKTLLNRLNGMETYMYVSMAQVGLLDFLFESGFKKEFEVSRMFLGSAVPQDCICLSESLERG